MGAWRRITIDDLLPLDQSDHLLLPSLGIPPKPKIQAEEPAPPVQESVSVKSSKSAKSTKSTKSAKSTKSGKKEKGKKASAVKEATPEPIVELWPMLLCKALLKLAGLTWTLQREIVDFDIINCLTGWIVQRVSTRGKLVRGKRT